MLGINKKFNKYRIIEMQPLPNFFDQISYYDSDQKKERSKMIIIIIID